MEPERRSPISRKTHFIYTFHQGWASRLRRNLKNSESCFALDIRHPGFLMPSWSKTNRFAPGPWCRIATADLSNLQSSFPTACLCYQKAHAKKREFKKNKNKIRSPSSKALCNFHDRTRGGGNVARAAVHGISDVPEGDSQSFLVQR